MSAASACSSCGAELGGVPACASCGAAAIGYVVAGKYRVEARIGAGGMGQVFRATHLALDAPVAIKLLHVDLADRALVRERFRREAVALASLRHPGIVSVLDFGEAEGELYAVMELLDGRALDAPRGGMAVTEAAPIFDQVLSALETCHRAGVVHRDVKPSNVMLTPLDGGVRATLIDFGLARIVDAPGGRLTTTGLVQGTPRYMAPEQCRGEEVGPAADIYALAVTMYEVLTGEDPFPVDDAASTMAYHLFVEPTPMREHVPSIPAGLEALVSRAMAKTPGERPTATEMRQELAAVLRGTDARSVAEAASRERRRVGTLARAQRSLASSRGAAPTSGAALGTALVWIASGARAASVSAALGARGLTTAIATGDELSAPTPPGTVVVVSARHDGSRQLERLRARDARVPVIAVDVASVDEASALIRAGVSDVSLEGAPDAELGAKIDRLLRRQERLRAPREP